MRLDQFKPSADALVRTFPYPEFAKDSAQFNVRVRYVTKESLDELKEQLRVQIVHRKKSDDLMTVERVEEFTQIEMALHAIVSIDKMTIGKLCDHAPFKEEGVTEFGLEAAVPMDPTVSGKLDEARANIRYLLNGSNEFLQWTLRTCTSIARFQDQEWKDRLSKTSGRGPGSNSEPASGASAATAAGA